MESVGYAQYDLKKRGILLRNRTKRRTNNKTNGIIKTYACVGERTETSVLVRARLRPLGTGAFMFIMYGYLGTRSLTKNQGKRIAREINDEIRNKNVEYGDQK